MDIGKAVREVKAGKIDFKVDRYGIIHAGVGKVSFTADQIHENANEVISSIVKMKPTSAKGTYMRSVTLSPTMGPGIAVEVKNA
jgi:large subunit ribosomal protein L1